MSLSRQQLTLLGIFALFLGPVILVILMRSSWWQYQPSGMKNHGHLVQPPVPLLLDQAPDVDGKWLILYVLEQECGEQCTEDVTALRQIHRASGRNREHLAIVLLSQTDAEPALRSRLESIYPEFQLLADSSTTALATLASVNRMVSNVPGGPGSIHAYVLDPMRNVILAYDASTSPNDIHKDLKRLLKWSDQEKPR
jgi:peroxiredoxin